MSDLSPEVRKQVEEILAEKLGTVIEPFDEFDLTELTNAIGRELARKALASREITPEDILAAVVAGVAAYMIYKWVRQMFT